MGDALAFVAEAEVALSADGDPAAVGAAVTAELCGHWEHQGPCRWPHNNAIRRGLKLATFRTLFVAEPSDEEMVRDRIEAALRARGPWQVVSVRARPVEHHEQALAKKLLTGPRLTEPR
jgi:hypothetical protein